MGLLSKKNIEHVAKLAKLDLTPQETKKFESQLSEIINYVSQLSDVDTSGIEPTSQTTGLKNVTRVDEIKPQDCLGQDKALSGTEETHNGYFFVPGILEERSDK